MKKLCSMVLVTIACALLSGTVGAGCFGSTVSSTATTVPLTTLSSPTTVTATDTTTTVTANVGTSSQGSSTIGTGTDTGTTGADTASTASTAPTSSTTTVTITFTAALSGADVVPPVSTTATGSATFTFESTLTRAYFVLKVSNIADVTASRLKEGKPGTNGQGVLILYPGPTIPGLDTGVLAQGWFNSTALIGPLYGKTIADLKALLESGEAYVNVGTDANPDGEIRGQVK